MSAHADMHLTSENQYLRELCSVSAMENRELRAENQRLRDALEPFAAYYEWQQARGIKVSPPALGPVQLQAARKALAGDAE